MPELDTKIAQWRRDARAGGIRSTAVLDELESHLREDIGHMMRAGTASRQAFELATRRMGSPAQLRNEFQKVPFKPYVNMTPIARRRFTEVLVVIAIIAISVAFLLPAVAKMKAHESLSAWDIAVCVTWTAATIIGGGYCAARVRRVG